MHASQERILQSVVTEVKMCFNWIYKPGPAQSLYGWVLKYAVYWGRKKE